MPLAAISLVDISDEEKGACLKLRRGTCRPLASGCLWGSAACSAPRWILLWLQHPCAHLLSYLQVNATGVMPVIFSSSLLALPASLARYTNYEALQGAAQALSPSGSLYLPANVALIVAFNYLYTFLQVGGRLVGCGGAWLQAACTVPLPLLVFEPPSARVAWVMQQVLAPSINLLCLG